MPRIMPKPVIGIILGLGLMSTVRLIMLYIGINY
jgi:hypothetical protein